MKRVFAFSLLTLMCVYTLAQNITLTFTGRDINNCYVQLNRVHVINHTQGWQKTLFWPDTTLTMQHSSNITEWGQGQTLQFSQNNPNPFKATTNISLSVTNKGMATLAIADGVDVYLQHILCFYKWGFTRSVLILLPQVLMYCLLAKTDKLLPSKWYAVAVAAKTKSNIKVL